MRMLLIQAPCWAVSTPPYNLALLKAVCLKLGHEVSCLDFNIKFYNYLVERGEQHIYKNPTDWYDEVYAKGIIGNYSSFIDVCVDEIIDIPRSVIGFTITGLNRFFSEEIARRIKNRDSSRIVVFGGPHCFRTEFGERLLHDSSYIDAVCYLEGERTLPALLDIIEKNRRIDYLAGIAFRNEDNQIIDCSDAELIDDLSSLPFADYSDFDLKEYSRRQLPISTSRGCVNRCIFCSESEVWGRYRYRSAENIFEEIRCQLSRYPFIKTLFFNDSLINGNIKMLDKLCDLLIRNKTNVRWGGQAAIRGEMTKGFIRKAKKAGLSHVSYGLESASPRVLRVIGKRFTPELAERVIRDTRKAGIRTYVNIIVGFPCEDEKDIIATADFLKRNRRFIDEVFFHPLVVSRGSYIYENRESFGIEFENEFNPNTWYSTKEENNMEKRLETLELCRRYAGSRGRSFFTLPNYYLFIADGYFNKGDYKKALTYYVKAKQTDKGRSKIKYSEDRINFIEKEMALTEKRNHDQIRSTQ